MKILLVKPGIALCDHVQPPLGIGCLAAVLRPAHEVRVLDFGMLGRSEKRFAAAASEFSPDIIGFQCYSPELGEVKRLASLARAALPGAVILAGGPHPTLCPEETMARLSPEADYLLRGEAEESFPLFIDFLSGRTGPESVPGLVWRGGGVLRVNAPRPVADIGSLPPPAWELLRPQDYPPAQHGAFFRRFPIAPVVTTRGCPFSCDFCAAPALSGSGVRRRGADSVMAEIELLFRGFGVREIHIVDDNFTLDREHAASILKRIAASGLPISLAFPNGLRIDTLDAELLDLMRAAGAYLVSVGIESGSDRNLGRLRKRLSKGLVREKAALIKSRGLDLAGFFVLGFPGETEEEMEETIRFALELPLLRASFFTFIPLPGAPLTRELLDSGEIGPVDPGRLGFLNVPYAPKGVTTGRLRAIRRSAYLRFYLRPGVFLRNLAQVRSPRHFRHLAGRFYRWIAR